MKVLILDQTHGGDKIGREHLKLGDDVTVVDVYGTMKFSEIQALRAEGMRCEVRAPPEQFDLAIVPVHCPDRFLANAMYRKRITHHEAVGRLVKFKMPVVEVTGVGGKTSACFALAHIFSSLGMKVLLHTSRGDFSYTDKIEVVNERTSIAPASLIDLSRMEGYDIAVIEESLGGCGLGEVCCVTTIGDDYDIAGNTRKAHDGKAQMIYLAKRKVAFPEDERDLWGPHVPEGVRSFTFGTGGDVKVGFDQKLQLGVPLDMRVVHGGHASAVTMPSTYLAPSYRTSFEAALCIVRAMELDMEKAVHSLSTFKGVPGRAEVEREGQWYMVRDRNPGVGARSIEWNLSILEGLYGVNDIGLVIDPMNIKICEKLNMHAIMRVAAEHPGVKKVYLFERGGGDEEYWKDLHHIRNVFDVWAQHKVLLWCTKEGYQ